MIHRLKLTLESSTPDTKFGREWREGLGRDESVAREKRKVLSLLGLGLFSFNRHNCERVCLGLNTRRTSRENAV